MKYKVWYVKRTVTLWPRNSKSRDANKSPMMEIDFNNIEVTLMWKKKEDDQS